MGGKKRAKNRAHAHDWQEDDYEDAYRRQQEQAHHEENKRRRQEQAYEEEMRRQQQHPPVFQKIQVTYTAPMFWAHTFLVYCFVASLVFCGESGCWTVQTWVHMLWAVQAFFYTVSYAGQWFPELERLALLTLLMPIHGGLWASIVMVPGSRTANALAQRQDLYVPWARGHGTWWTTGMPLLVFYVYCFAKHNVIGITFSDWRKSLGKPLPAWQDYGSHACQVFGGMLLPCLFEWLISPAGLAYDRTDMFLSWSVAQSMHWLFFIYLIANGLLWMGVLAASVTFMTPVVWLDYYRQGIMLMEDLRTKSEVVGLVC